MPPYAESRAFVWEDGTMTDLGALAAPEAGASASYAYDVNDRGQVAGMTVGTATRAVLWTVPPHRHLAAG